MPSHIPLQSVASADGRLALQGGDYDTEHGVMRCFDVASGKQLWTYPDNFVGVHGSHNACGPTVGMIRGSFTPVGFGQTARADRQRLGHSDQRRRMAHPDRTWLLPGQAVRRGSASRQMARRSPARRHLRQRSARRRAGRFRRQHRAGARRQVLHPVGQFGLLEHRTDGARSRDSPAGRQRGDFRRRSEPGPRHSRTNVASRPSARASWQSKSRRQNSPAISMAISTARKS